MRARLLVLSVLFGIVTSASALEKVAVPMDREEPQPWDAGATCLVSYANTCTGWVWVWSGYDTYDKVGVVLDPCCDGGRLMTTQLYFWTGAIVGWGYTGMVSVSPVVSGCPGPAYESRPCLPPGGARVDSWENIPAGPVLLSYTFGPTDGEGPGGGWQAGKIPTDHPAAGPTGPQACGFCYASTRTIHTFYFGKADSPLCPGSPLNDGVCDAEALYWSGQFSCMVAAEATTWGSLKSLYR